MIFQKSRQSFIKFRDPAIKKFQNLSTTSQGIIWMVLTCLLVSIMVSIVRHLSKDLHVFQIVMMRNFFALLFFFPYIVKSHAGIFKTKKLHLHIWRGIVGLLGMLVWFYTITLIPLAEAVSITFITPIFTTLAAMMFLKEKVTKKEWSALIIGFIGVLIITKPGFREFKPAYFLALLTASIWATSTIFVKVMTKTEKPETIVVYMCFIIFFLSVPVAAPYLTALSWDNIFWLAAIGLVSNLAHISMSTAYGKTNISILQPIDFTRLVFTAIIAYFAFNEVIDIATIIGSIVILFSTIYFAPRSKSNFSVRVKNLFKKKNSQIGIDL
jgi:drug/metabolite transporter (DMT)-like permease